MNGDTVDRIAQFLDGRADLPQMVRNHMLLIALKHERDARREENAEILNVVRKNSDALLGEQGDQRSGLKYRVDRLESIVRLVLWLMSPILLSFLGGVGMLIFNRLIN